MGFIINIQTYTDKLPSFKFKPRIAEKATTESSPVDLNMIDDDRNEDDDEEARKTLRIEVHATATHHVEDPVPAKEHQQLEPVVAHAQQHDISHNQAVSLIPHFSDQ